MAACYWPPVQLEISKVCYCRFLHADAFQTVWLFDSARDDLIFWEVLRRGVRTRSFLPGEPVVVAGSEQDILFAIKVTT